MYFVPSMLQLTTLVSLGLVSQSALCKKPPQHCDVTTYYTYIAVVKSFHKLIMGRNVKVILGLRGGVVA